MAGACALRVYSETLETSGCRGSLFLHRHHFIPIVFSAFARFALPTSLFLFSVVNPFFHPALFILAHCLQRPFSSSLLTASSSGFFTPLSLDCTFLLTRVFRNSTFCQFVAFLILLSARRASSSTSCLLPGVAIPLASFSPSLFFTPPSRASSPSYFLLLPIGSPRVSLITSLLTVPPIVPQRVCVTFFFSCPGCDYSIYTLHSHCSSLPLTPYIITDSPSFPSLFQPLFFLSCPSRIIIFPFLPSFEWRSGSSFLNMVFMSHLRRVNAHPPSSFLRLLKTLGAVPAVGCYSSFVLVVSIRFVDLVL